MSKREEYWSDSDEEPPSGTETSVLLGIPDGPVTAVADIRDAAVSRIGGHPALLPFTEPSFSSSFCNSCSNPMELLVQMWCPFENSPMDRAMYVWGCARRRCQKKEGSIRAWRGLRINVEYAAKLAKKSDKEKSKPVSKKNDGAPISNPFSMMNTPPPDVTGLGSLIFDDKPDDPPSSLPDDNDTESSSDDELLTAMASVTIQDSEWASAPSYPPIYLSTVTEYLPPSTDNSAYKSLIQDPEDGKGGKDTPWAAERYESSQDLDRVFDIFSRRVSCQGEQCVRYELGGKPLPFGSDKVFDRLFPLPVPSSISVTKAAFVVAPPLVRAYQPTSIPHCPCGSRRVFECQLMPNLINTLGQAKKGDNKKPTTDQERMKELEGALRGGDDGDEKRDMEWGTCMIFSCEKDCCNDDGRECWREEIVLVEWDE